MEQRFIGWEFLSVGFGHGGDFVNLEEHSKTGGRLVGWRDHWRWIRSMFGVKYKFKFVCDKSLSK